MTSRHRPGRRRVPRAISTTARHRSTAAATKCSATSSRPPFSDCEAAMDFQLSDEQALLRDTIRDLLSRTYDPESRNKVIESDLGWSRDVWSQLADTGILGLGFEPDEAGQIEVMVVLTEIGRRLAPEPVVHAALAPGALIAERGQRLAEASCWTRSRPVRSCSRSLIWKPATGGRPQRRDSGCAARRFVDTERNQEPGPGR